jgi:hypothetical protein
VTQHHHHHENILINTTQKRTKRSENAESDALSNAHQSLEGRREGHQRYDCRLFLIVLNYSPLKLYSRFVLLFYRFILLHLGGPACLSSFNLASCLSCISRFVDGNEWCPHVPEHQQTGTHSIVSHGSGRNWCHPTPTPNSTLHRHIYHFLGSHHHRRYREEAPELG